MKKLLSVTVNIALLQTMNSTSLLPLLRTEATGGFLWAGSRQWAGSLLPLCVTSLSQTFALGSLSIYGEVLHFPPLTDGAIPCRHRSCSPCVWENVCVTDRVIERGARGSEEEGRHTLQGRDLDLRLTRPQELLRRLHSPFSADWPGAECVCQRWMILPSSQSTDTL